MGFLTFLLKTVFRYDIVNCDFQILMYRLVAGETDNRYVQVITLSL